MIDKEKRIQEINETEKMLKASEELRNEALTKKKMYEEQLKEKEDALKKLGTTPEDAENKIKELDLEIQKNIKYIQENLPVDLLRKWKKI